MKRCLGENAAHVPPARHILSVFIVCSLKGRCGLGDTLRIWIYSLTLLFATGVSFAGDFASLGLSFPMCHRQAQ